MESSIKLAIFTILLLQHNILLVISQQNHINSFISNGLSAAENTERHNNYGGGCRRPSLEITANSISSKSTLHKVAICKSLKPIKPSRLLDMSKSLCAPNWTICNHLEKGIVGLAWNKLPKGCFGFKFGNEAKNKATGYGSKCYRNLYFDGILCCPNDKSHHKKKNIYNKKNTKHYLLTNEIH